MKQVYVIALLLLCVVSVFGQPYDGPFGLKMGLTLEQLKAIDPDLIPLKNNGYFITAIPKPHPSFDKYFLDVSPKTGLCRIMTLDEDIKTNSQGTQLRTQYGVIRDALAKKYGAFYEKDFLYPGSTMEDPHFYMLSLLKKERVLGSDWNTDSKANLSDGITNVTLITIANDLQTGSIMLIYEFSNCKEFEEELKDDQDSAF